jgi:putative ABC transport system permease protein
MRSGLLLLLALRSLARNKMRSFLTMLGIIIGVAAVIAMLAVGNGARTSMEASIASLGTNVINVFPGAQSSGGVRGEAGSGGRFTAEDVEEVRKQAAGVKYVSPVARTSAQLKAGGSNWRSSIYGVSSDYLLIRQWDLTSGSNFSLSEQRSGAKVAILGRTVADSLFGPGSDPVGQTMRVGNLPFRVIGVLKAKGQSSWGQDQDDIVIAPFSTVSRKLLATFNAQSLIASAVTAEAIPAASMQIEDVLRRRLRVPESEASPFSIRTQTEITEAATSMSTTLTLLLSSIAGISLLVGGIGIMNIMLVSVTERTREIGIRLALGARGRDILLQFLVEALVMSFAGGLIGIALGVGVSALLASAQGWAVQVSLSSILLAFSFSAATGIFFGWYPARKAAKLNPIEALRYE